MSSTCQPSSCFKFCVLGSSLRILFLSVVFISSYIQIPLSESLTVTHYIAMSLITSLSEGQIAMTKIRMRLRGHASLVLLLEPDAHEMIPVPGVVTRRSNANTLRNVGKSPKSRPESRGRLQRMRLQPWYHRSIRAYRYQSHLPTHPV